MSFTTSRSYCQLNLFDDVYGLEDEQEDLQQLLGNQWVAGDDEADGSIVHDIEHGII